MTERDEAVLLQVCANDHPPFADICRYHAAAARALSWRPVTVMLEARAAAPDPEFHYLGDLNADAAEVLGGERPVLTVCHRYRAYRQVAGCRSLSGPVVVVAHEFALLQRWQRRLRLHWDRLRGRGAVRFAGVSDAVAQELAAAAGDAVLLPNGMDLARADELRLSREAAAAELGLSRRDFNIGVVGRLHPKKDPALALEAFRLALPDIPDARLVFVGRGDLEAELTAAAAGLPVAFKGFVPRAPQLLSGLDLLVIPSGRREAFGMVVLEAMAAGVPVLAGPAPGPRFVLGATGTHFSPATPEALAQAFRTARAEHRSGLLAQRAMAARARVETEFSVAAGARRLAALAGAVGAGTQR